MQNAATTPAGELSERARSATRGTPLRGHERHRRLRRIRRRARLLDDVARIPGTRIRIGLDPLLGLIPGLGDLASAALSLSLVWEARQLGVSRGLLARMLGNVALETLVGSVPLVGDVFDVGFRANRRNVVLLERALGAGREAPRSRGEPARARAL